MGQIDSKRKTGIVHLAILLLVFGVFAAVLFSGFFPKYKGIKILALISFTPVFAAFVVFVVESLRKGKASIFRCNNNYPFIIIVAGMLIAYLPYLTQPFLFGDDLWGFTGKANNDLGFYLDYYRCLASIPGSLYSGISWGNSNLGRCITFVAVIAFVWLVYRWMLVVSKKRLTSFVVAFSVAIGLPMADMLGFLSVFPLVFGLVFSVFSVSLLYEVHVSREMSKAHRAWLTMTAILSMFIGFNCYIIATPIVFLLCASLLFFSTRSNRSNSFVIKYALVMILAGAMFYGINAFACDYYDVVGNSSRGSLSFDPLFYADKGVWFFTVVLPQTIYSIWMSVIGTALSARHNLFWGASIDQGVSIFILLVTAGLLAFLMARVYQREKRPLLVIGLVALIPASFYPFLLLPESNYMSYYAFPLYCLVIFYTILALREIALIIYRWRTGSGTHVSRKGNKKTPLYIVIAVALLMVGQANCYSQQAWVNFCSKGYLIAKNTIMSNIDAINATKHIHVYGSAHPVSVSTYPIYLIKQVLSDVDYQFGDLVVTASTTESYLGGMNDDQRDAVLAQASPQTVDTINKYYIKDEYYNIYWYTVPEGQSDELTASDTAIIRDAFIASGLIPSEGSAVFVDYRMYWQWVMF